MFACDLTVPVTGNHAERELWMIKAELKFSGGWRTRYGARAWSCVRGYVSAAVTPSPETLGRRKASK